MTDPRPVRRVVPAHEKRCVWMTAGILAYRLCSLDYECAGCALDQALRLSCGDRSRRGIEPVPPLHLLHRGHAWLRPEPDGTAVTGLDDFGQRLAGLVTWVELPAIAAEVTEGEPLWRLSHGPHELEVAAPVSGRVVEVNDGLRENPGRVNRSPYDAGWVARLLPTDLARDLPKLLFGQPAEAWLGEEIRRLERELAAALDLDLEPNAAGAPRLNDGGEVPTDLLRGLPREARSRILRAFLRGGAEDGTVLTGE